MITPEVWELLRAYTWPGNIRELNNVIERAVVLAPEGTIDVDDLPEELREVATVEATAAPASVPALPGDIGPYRDAVINAKRAIILRALEETGGHQTKAAELLGVRQPYLARLIKNLRVPKP